MRQLFKNLLTITLSAALCFIAGCSGNDRLPPLEPEGPDPEKPAVEGIPLSIRNRDFNNITFTQEGDEWIIRTTGLDPYIWFDAAIPVNFKKQYMLAFDSFNTTETLPLVIFVGEVCDGDHLLENGDYTLPRTEGGRLCRTTSRKSNRRPPYRSNRCASASDSTANIRSA